MKEAREMEYIYDNEVRMSALTDDETVLQILRPGKKAFFFYRVVFPAVALLIVLITLALSLLVISLSNGLSLTGMWIYAIAIVLVLIASLINYFVQKKMYIKKAYYITNKRLLFVGGLFQLKMQTLNYRFIGSVTLKRTPFSKALGLTSYSINLLMNINKRLTVKFFTLAGQGLSYLESADKAYKEIVNRI